MFISPRVLFATAALLILIAGAMTVHQAHAGRIGAFQRTSTVVTIDLSRVLSSLEQYTSESARLAELGAKLESELKARQTEAQAAVEAVRALADRPRSDPERRRQEEAANRAILNLEAHRSFSVSRIDIEKSIIMQNLHREVQRQLRSLCELRGYDIVLANDASREITVNPELNVSREAQVFQQIASQRVIHAMSTSDITNELIDRMNNAFANP